MSRNSQSMTRIQKQAAIVCAVCALAVMSTASVTSVLLATTGGSPSSRQVPPVGGPEDLGPPD